MIANQCVTLIVPLFHMNIRAWVGGCQVDIVMSVLGIGMVLGVSVLMLV